MDMLFVAVEVKCGVVMTSWLVPSPVFARLVGEPHSKGRLRFSETGTLLFLQSQTGPWAYWLFR